MSAGIRFLASEGQYRRILTSGTLLQHLGTSQPWDDHPPPFWKIHQPACLPASTLFLQYPAQHDEHVLAPSCALTSGLYCLIANYNIANKDNLTWFADHLQTLKTHPHSPKVNTSLYVTTASSSNSTSADVSDAENTQRAPLGAGAAEKDAFSSSSRPRPRPVVVTTTSSSSDPEKTGGGSGSGSGTSSTKGTRSSTSTNDTAYSHGHAIKPGRPDTATLIREAVLSTPATGRVLVAACGPAGLMTTVRDVTASLIRGDGPGVELHCEQFGW